MPGYGGEAPLVHLSVLLSSSLRFAGYFDVPNLIEGIRRTDLLTSSLLIAVLFDVGECPTKNVQPLVHSLCRGLLVVWNRADPLSHRRSLTFVCTYLENRFFKVGFKYIFLREEEGWIRILIDLKKTPPRIDRIKLNQIQRNSIITPINNKQL